MCLGGGSVPNAPDVSQQSSASSAIGQQAQAAGTSQLNWANGQASQNGANTANVQAQLNPLIGQQAGAGQAATGQFQNQTIPGLNQQLTTAQNYGNQAGMDQASANAAATTAQAYNAARLNNQQQLGSYGVDPSTMKSGALNLNANLQQAGAVGNAAYNAGQARQQAGMALTSQALGQNLSAAGVGQNYTAGANATGSNLVGLGNQTTATSSSALTAPSTMLQTGLSGEGQSANILNQQFGNEMAAYNANQANSNSLMSGIGTVVGSAAKAYTGGLADGGAIPPRRYANGGAMVPVQGAQAIQQGYQMPQQGQQSQQQSNTNSLLSAAGTMAGQGVGQYQGNQAVAAIDNQIANDPQMQQLWTGTPNLGNDGLPTLANGGAIPQRKRMDYGQAQQHPQGVPPQVGIPGPWVAANGGSPGPGFIDPSQGPSDGTGIDDQIPARVSVGEFIIPADVVHAKGKEFFDKLLQRYHTPAQQQRQQMGMPARGMN